MDPYETLTCTTCGNGFQAIDFRCSAHLLICANPTMPPAERHIDLSGFVDDVPPGMVTEENPMARKRCVNHPDRLSLPGFKPGVGLCQECWNRSQGWPTPARDDVPPVSTASPSEAFEGRRQ